MGGAHLAPPYFLCLWILYTTITYSNFSSQIAIKNLQKRIASKDYLTRFLPREISVLQLVNHPNILHVYQIIETEEKCFFMLELADNGDLLDYINSRGHLPEDEARYIFKQLTSAILYCHSIGVVHRDLKCENIMISRDMQVKIGGKRCDLILLLLLFCLYQWWDCSIGTYIYFEYYLIHSIFPNILPSDFGFALQTANPAHTPCGSYSYAAPELFTASNDGYDATKADVWSL